MLPMLRQCYESARTAKMVAASIREGEAAPLAVAVSRTVAPGPFTTMVRELSHAFAGLQLQLRRGTGAEVTEYLKQGTAQLAIAGPLDEPWSRPDALPVFGEPCQLRGNRNHRPADRRRVESQAPA